MRYEYKTINTQTLTGLKEAERLKQTGWIIILNGIFTLMFQRSKPNEEDKNQ
jgi:hypothetical protein